ncbi:Crp/Fnr family transcriptional regulator [Gynurincola endophyticus]|jgi:CRP-like cAMP-binding protein|uniref:Crp/Fnr family transcriptional regulator n=1 Tax=Gynurincola endophyticus TaxID=2479004 RepID=UPI000F8EC730|nr:cyclic nucleotide-binding domain-containing protein [Gynurincola endophyticus]
MPIRKSLHEIGDYIYNYLQRYMDVTREEVQFLIGFLELRSFNRKEKILNVGEVDQHLNMVIQGIVRKYIEVDGLDCTLQIAQEGHFIQSDRSFHEQSASEIVIEAVEKTTIISISHQQLQRLLASSDRWERLGTNILMLLLKHRESRIYKKRALSSREYFMHFLKHHPDIIQRVPQKYIASYLGVKPETFSRLKHLLKGKRLYKNNIS